ncbi:protein kinase superfamily protein [Striga asiatica]|uniref:non-specific serine/threonine protein kinase n=1 Tax=Striga asiatica TaxID=4170 RepID=A0A5A7PVT2_STRAF|nr:protein kinase superfamily protein [Striga asiatica]
MSDDSHRNSDSEGLYSGKSSMSSDTTATTAAISHSSASLGRLSFELPEGSPEQAALRTQRASDSSARGFRDFSLVRQIGSGDIGRVYLCRLRGAADDGRLYAMKVVDNDVLALKKKTERAEAERRVMRRLDHPFLPTLFAEFEASQFSCVVMEYCSGGDLHSLRHKQPHKRFSISSARFYAAEVLVALEYLHMLGIIYRDLKPENVLVRSDGHIMLTDFDLSLCSDSTASLESPDSSSSSPSPPSARFACLPAARLFRSRKVQTTTALVSGLRFVAEPVSARSCSFVGTHEYVAPEVASGGPHGSSVDWWAFGVFIYEMIYGRTPFVGPTNETTLRNIVRAPLGFPGPPSREERAARDLIAGLLEKDPARRLGSRHGAADVKTHPFFKGMNFALVRSVEPPGLSGIRRQKTAPARPQTAVFGVF